MTVGHRGVPVPESTTALRAAPDRPARDDCSVYGRPARSDLVTMWPAAQNGVFQHRLALLRSAHGDSGSTLRYGRNDGVRGREARQLVPDRSLLEPAFGNQHLPESGCGAEFIRPDHAGYALHFTPKPRCHAGSRVRLSGISRYRVLPASFPAQGDSGSALCDGRNDGVRGRGVARLQVLSRVPPEGKASAQAAFSRYIASSAARRVASGSPPGGSQARPTAKWMRGP